MNDKEHHTRTDRSKRNPAFFLIRRFVALRQSIGIIEYEHSRLKSDIVFQQVSPVLVVIPLEAHGRYPAANLS
jgi:hypothetical protein